MSNTYPEHPPYPEQQPVAELVDEAEHLSHGHDDDHDVFYDGSA
ncbi:MAG TPA: hypothetical protein VHH13_11825 [Arthrobacter sp.]|nr:hypothetical protein [Arthrobacter sp.]